MMDLRTGDDVLLISSGKWYRVRGRAYRQHLGYTCGLNPQAIYGDWLFIGIGDTGQRQLQVDAIAEVWRDGYQVWPPVAEQLSLFAIEN